MVTIMQILKYIVLIMGIIQAIISMVFVKSPSKLGTFLTRTYPFIFAFIAVLFAFGY